MCRGGPEVPLIVSGTGSRTDVMSHQVIARKFRPQTFAELVGQQHVVRTLENAIRTGRVAHAYIFSGARGVGKTTTARILAKALNCVKGPTTEPCNECASCREITAGNSLDVLEIDAASNRGIDQVRELREMVRYAPAGARHKVVILDEAHMLTTEASNALLKTLEEPPDKVIFVMATTEPERLVDTIRSRSQHFHFRALSFAEIIQALESIAAQEKVAAEPGALAVIARAADGSLRDGLSLLEQALAYCGDNITEAQVREILGVVASGILDELTAAVEARSATRVLALVHQLARRRTEPAAVLPRSHRPFPQSSGGPRLRRRFRFDRRRSPKSTQRLARAAASFSEEDLTRFFQILLHTEDDVRRKPDPRLHLEMGLLRLVQAARLAPLEEVIAELSSGSAPQNAATRRATPAPRRSAAAGRAATRAPKRAAAAAPCGSPASASAAGADMKPESHAAPLVRRRASARRPFAGRGRSLHRNRRRPRRRAGSRDQVGHRFAATIPRRTGRTRHALADGQRRSQPLLPHRTPRPGRNVAVARVHGEVAHHRQRAFWASRSACVLNWRPRRSCSAPCAPGKIPASFARASSRIRSFARCSNDSAARSPTSKAAARSSEEDPMEVRALQQLLTQFRQMQENLQQQVDAVHVEASAGGGMVTVKMNGQKQVTELRIEPEVFAGKDAELVQDLVRAAVNDAVRRVDEELASQVKGMAGGLPGIAGLKIPGLF